MNIASWQLDEREDSSVSPSRPTVDVDLQLPPGCHSAVISRESRKKTWRRTLAPLTAEKRSAPLLYLWYHEPSRVLLTAYQPMINLSLCRVSVVWNIARTRLLFSSRTASVPVSEATVRNSFRCCLRRNASQRFSIRFWRPTSYLIGNFQNVSFLRLLVVLVKWWKKTDKKWIFVLNSTYGVVRIYT